ncbi:DUF488 domain-containing protein [Sporanaerobium hydrogeniformans]|uniref:DUF488 domain-containing protein n=1 Tax=Sporanaerobium hydrogeniformans TaxID=3072179 RepID=UPI0015D4A9C4|nr:DUF488 domain-containing protein [Sporanaerobium hydrogeniformans]
MNIYTIGFTKKTAREFFEKISDTPVQLVLDVRLNNVSQLAGFSKGNDLKYFLDKICRVQYAHDIKFAPTKEILKDYKDKKMTWEEYEKRYFSLMQERDIITYFNNKYLNKDDNICLLCSEATPENCHRRLLAEILKASIDNVTIYHI